MNDFIEIPPTAPKKRVKPPNRRWTEEEIKFLRRHYVRMGREFVADHLQRSRTCVAGKARHIGIRREVHRDWSRFEDNYIARMFGKKPSRSISRTLQRSIHAVRARASMLGVTVEKVPPYTKEERALIKQLYESGVSATVIARQLGRPESSIRTRINRWGFKSSRPWTKREERFLQKNYHTMKIRELAQALGRTLMAVNHYANRHGMKKRGEQENELPA